MSISAQRRWLLGCRKVSAAEVQLILLNRRTTQDVKPRLLSSPFRLGRERDMDEDATDNRRKGSAGMALRDVEVSILRRSRNSVGYYAIM